MDLSTSYPIFTTLNYQHFTITALLTMLPIIYGQSIYIYTYTNGRVILLIYQENIYNDVIMLVKDYGFKIYYYLVG